MTPRGWKDLCCTIQMSQCKIQLLYWIKIWICPAELTSKSSQVVILHHLCGAKKLHKGRVICFSEMERNLRHECVYTLEKQGGPNSLAYYTVGHVAILLLLITLKTKMWMLSNMLSSIHCCLALWWISTAWSRHLADTSKEKHLEINVNAKRGEAEESSQECKACLLYTSQLFDTQSFHFGLLLCSTSLKLE